MPELKIKDQSPHCSKHVLPAVPLSEVYLEDCVTALKRYADNHFDLAIVDPPYGIDSKISTTSGLNKGNKFAQLYNEKRWDKFRPENEYWNELLRVSKNQIVWGGNYFHNLHLTGVIVWNKKGSGKFKEGEMAKTSLNTFKVFDYSRADAYINDCDMKIHPTQKPVKLYEWLLKNYAKPTDKILDTHFGSCSIGIACHNFGCSLDACELDGQYFDNAYKRLRMHVRQLDLFK